MSDTDKARLGDWACFALAAVVIALAVAAVVVFSLAGTVNG
jgi:hypothetical protein